MTKGICLSMTNYENMSNLVAMFVPFCNSISIACVRAVMWDLHYIYFIKTPHIMEFLIKYIYPNIFNRYVAKVYTADMIFGHHVIIVTESMSV